jgi:hypothetical protein
MLKKSLQKLYFLTCSGLVNGKQSRHVLKKLLVTESTFSHMFRSSEREAVSSCAQEVTEAIFSKMFRSSEREAVSLRRPEVHRAPPTHLQHKVRHQVPPQI